MFEIMTVIYNSNLARAKTGADLCVPDRLFFCASIAFFIASPVSCPQIGWEQVKKIDTTTEGPFNCIILLWI